jgi:signal transduction histidine kinase
MSDGPLGGLGNAARAASEFLIEPRTELGAVERHKARLLASFLLCLLALGLLSGLTQAAMIPNFQSTFAAMAAALVVISVAYVGSRTRMYRLSAAVAAVAPALACIVIAVRSPDDRVWYGFILITVIIATLFFSVRTAAVVAAAVFAVLCIVPIWVLELRAPARIVPLLALHGILSPLMLIAAWHHAAIERENQKELRRMDARIAEIERLEGVARIAGSTAHDFNNLITVVGENLRLLERKLSESRCRELEDMHMAVERASALSRQLLVSARDEKSHAETFDVGELVRAFEPLLVRLAGSRVRVNVRPDDAPQAIRMNPVHLERVLMNLIVNARDAMPNGGSVTVETRSIVLDGGHEALHAGSHVMIAVTDTGVGMSPSTLERIFEPFFTTKPPGSGTGLGLAIVREIVEQNRGHLAVKSAPGSGTILRVYLPAAVPTLGMPEAS